MKRIALIVAFVLASLVCGCASTGNNTALSAASRTLSAQGYSHFDDSGSMSVNQRWLIAQQTAKLDAYRGLADLLYKEVLGGQTTVGSQVVSDEPHRVYFDTYLRSARAVDYRTVKDTLRATLELTITPRFYRCMSGNTTVVEQCLQEDNKLAFTRIGYKTAETASVNMACGNRDCSDQLYVKGFSKERNPVDNMLLDFGLYDLEWAANSSADVWGRYLLLKGLINGF